MHDELVQKQFLKDMTMSHWLTQRHRMLPLPLPVGAAKAGRNHSTCNTPLHPTGTKRLDDLERTSLFRRRIIWLLPHPITPPVNKLDWRQTGRLRKRDNLLTGEGGRRNQIIRRSESLVLYKSFNTLWPSDVAKPYM
jgi:hypothetical protein